MGMTDSPPTLSSCHRSRRILVAAVVGCLAALGFAGSALAYRRAPQSELRAIVYGRPGYPRSIPVRCFKGDISTKVGGSNWAGVTFSTWAYGQESQCETGDGWNIAHKRRGAWSFVWSGDWETYPSSWLALTQAANALGIARQTARSARSGSGLAATLCLRARRRRPPRVARASSRAAAAGWRGSARR